VDDQLAIVSIILWVLVPLVVFLARNWLVTWITKGVQHRFDIELEKVRSELRDKEGEISTLRNNVLSGSASRRSLLDKRRFDAVERVWTAVNDMAQLKTLSSMMAIVNFKAVAKDIDHPSIDNLLTMLGSATPDLKDLKKNVARDEQPFLPDLAWAYFAAYRSILYGTYMRYAALKNKMRDTEKYLTSDGTRKILKAALPHQSKFIDENEPETYHYLLEEIEGYLLNELRKILEGRDADQAAAQQAKEIMKAVNEGNKEDAKQSVANARNEN